jgi:hypothetical protein
MTLETGSEKVIVMNKALLIGVPLAALLAAGVFFYPRLRDANQHATEHTATGGEAHHHPIQYRNKDSREAITEPEFVAAGKLQIAGGTKGIGVSIDGESRFYPLYVLQYHQVINDKIGNSAIACSY